MRCYGKGDEVPLWHTLSTTGKISIPPLSRERWRTKLFPSIPPLCMYAQEILKHCLWHIKCSCSANAPNSQLKTNGNPLLANLKLSEI